MGSSGGWWHVLGRVVEPKSLLLIRLNSHISLPLSPTCWDGRNMPPHPSLSILTYLWAANVFMHMSILLAYMYVCTPRIWLVAEVVRRMHWAPGFGEHFVLLYLPPMMHHDGTKTTKTDPN